MLGSLEPISPSVWKEAREDNWLTEFDIGPVSTYYELLGEYASLPRSARRGYRIDRWVRQNDARISKALQSAKACLNGMLVTNESEDH